MEEGDWLVDDESDEEVSPSQLSVYSGNYSENPVENPVELQWNYSGNPVVNDEPHRGAVQEHASPDAVSAQGEAGQVCAQGKRKAPLGISEADGVSQD